MVEKRSIIVGAGVAGKELVDQLKSHRSLGYIVVGFVDDNEAKLGNKIRGIPVIGKTDQLEQLISQHGVENVFIAIPSAQGGLIRSLVNSCQKAKVTFRIVPRTLEIVRGKVNLEAIRSVSIEDVLGRAILKSEQAQLKKIFAGKRILVTGAAGSIGSEVARQLAQFNPKLLVMLDWWENGLFALQQELSNLGEQKKQKIIVGNIQDRQKVNWIFSKYKPQIVFHAAAFKHVPLMEEHPEEAVKNNILGTKNLAEIAGENKVQKFIFISTDKAVNPTSVMGATKAFSELLVRYFNKIYNTKYISVRFGNVMGSNGSVVPLFQKQIASGGPVTVTHPDMVRFFMSIPEAVQLILQAARMGKGGEIFVLDMGEPVKIIDLARTMISLAGFEPEKEIAIKIIGKRPGEKIFEEVLTREEEIQKTDNKLIFVTRNVLHIGDQKLLASFRKLSSLTEIQDRPGITGELARILPEYGRRRMGKFPGDRGQRKSRRVLKNSELTPPASIQLLSETL